MIERITPIPHKNIPGGFCKVKPRENNDPFRAVNEARAFDEDRFGETGVVNLEPGIRIVTDAELMGPNSLDLGDDEAARWLRENDPGLGSISSE